MVLIVAVHGDDALAVGPGLQKIGKSRFQSGAFAPVDLMVQQMDLRVGVRRVLKPGQILRLGAVVDQNNVGKSVFQKPIDHSVQLFVRIQRGQDYRNVR